MRKAGIALGVLLVVAALAGAAWFWLKWRPVVDPAAVARIAAEMLPGAAPPGGTSACLALQLDDLRVAVFAPSLAKVHPERLQGSDIRIVVARPEQKTDQPPALDQIRQKLDKAGERQAEEVDVLDKQPCVLSVGGKPYPGVEQHQSLKQGGARLREYVTLFPRDGAPVVVLITGPEATFDRRTMDAFLGALPAPAAPPALDAYLPGRAAPPPIPAPPHP